MTGIADNPALLLVVLALLAIPVALLVLAFMVGSRTAPGRGPQALGPPMGTARPAARRGRARRDIVTMVLLAGAVVALLIFGYPVILIALVGLAALPPVAQVTLVLGTVAVGGAVWATRCRRPVQ